MNSKFRHLIAASLALAALLAAASARAQQSNGSPDGLYVLPDAEQAERDKHESPSNRAAASYADSLDPEAQRKRQEMEQAQEVRRAIQARKSANGLADSQGPGWVPETLDFTERGWIVLLSSMAVMISLGAAGYLWWNRTQQTKMPATVLMPMKPRATAAKTATSESTEQPKRRAA